MKIRKTPSKHSKKAPKKLKKCKPLSIKPKEMKPTREPRVLMELTMPLRAMPPNSSCVTNPELFKLRLMLLSI